MCSAPGSVGQLAFDFGLKTAVVPESLTQQLAWETAVLGWPVSANPASALDEERGDAVRLRALPQLRNLKSTIVGVRLPGWTGGRGFYFGDGDSYEIVRLDKSLAAATKVKSWQPYRLTGFWRVDEWGSGWFDAVALAKPA